MRTPLLALAAIATMVAGCASTANTTTPSAAMVIEIATFTLNPGVTPEQFRPLDRAVEEEHVAQQPGFVSREAGVSEDGQWVAIVHWRSAEDAEASMASFASAPATAAFMGHLQADTMVMTRYQKQ